MNRNDVRAAKIKLGAVLISGGWMAEGPLSFRYANQSDLDEISKALGKQLPEAPQSEGINRQRVFVIEDPTPYVDEALKGLVNELATDLIENLRKKRDAGGASMAAVDDKVGFGVGVGRRGDSRTDFRVLLKVFAPGGLRNARRLGAEWSARLSEGLKVHALVQRMTPLTVHARKGGWYQQSRRPLSIGVGVSGTKSVTVSATAAVRVIAGKPAGRLKGDHRYLLTSGHGFGNDSDSQVFQPSLQHHAGADVVAKVVISSSPVRVSDDKQLDYCLAELGDFAFANAYGQDARPIRAVFTGEVDPGNTKTEKIGGAGTGDVEAIVDTVEMDADIRSLDGRKVRYLDLIELAGEREISVPGDSGSLVCIERQAFGMVVTGFEERGQDEVRRRWRCLVTDIAKVLDKHNLELAY